MSGSSSSFVAIDMGEWGDQERDLGSGSVQTNGILEIWASVSTIDDAIDRSAIRGVAGQSQLGVHWGLARWTAEDVDVDGERGGGHEASEGVAAPQRKCRSMLLLGPQLLAPLSHCSSPLPPCPKQPFEESQVRPSVQSRPRQAQGSQTHRAHATSPFPFPGGVRETAGPRDGDRRFALGPGTWDWPGLGAGLG